MTDLDLFRVYLQARPDGYPYEWARLPGETYGPMLAAEETADMQGLLF